MLLKEAKKPLWISRCLEAAVEEHHDLFRNPLQCCHIQLFMLGRCPSPTKHQSPPMPSPVAPPSAHAQTLGMASDPGAGHC